jgi:hypothetical protein
MLHWRNEKTGVEEDDDDSARHEPTPSCETTG